jgi:hypothetical protein
MRNMRWKSVRAALVGLTALGPLTGCMVLTTARTVGQVGLLAADAVAWPVRRWQDHRTRDQLMNPVPPVGVTGVLRERDQDWQRTFRPSRGNGLSRVTWSRRLALPGPDQGLIATAPRACVGPNASRVFVDAVTASPVGDPFPVRRARGVVPEIAWSLSESGAQSALTTVQQFSLAGLAGVGRADRVVGAVLPSRTRAIGLVMEYDVAEREADVITPCVQRWLVVDGAVLAKGLSATAGTPFSDDMPPIRGAATTARVSKEPVVARGATTKQNTPSSSDVSNDVSVWERWDAAPVPGSWQREGGRNHVMVVPPSTPLPTTAPRSSDRKASTTGRLPAERSVFAPPTTGEAWSDVASPKGLPASVVAPPTLPTTTVDPAVAVQNLIRLEREAAQWEARVMRTGDDSPLPGSARRWVEERRVALGSLAALPANRWCGWLSPAVRSGTARRLWQGEPTLPEPLKRACRAGPSR